MTAEQIKQSVSMSDITDRYGIERNGAGFSPCIFHSEKTASLKFYDGSFFCFGCSKSGDVIKFVQLLFGIDYRQAVIRIQTDFNLIDTGSQEDSKLWLANKKASDKLNRQIKEQEHKIFIIEANQAIALRHLININNRIINEFQPTDDDFPDIWCQAIHDRDKFQQQYEEVMGFG
jgi:DNA primase